MIVLPNMGLVKWDSIGDVFSHEQLAANFQALDTHDHTAGKGKQIPYGGLAEQSVGKENLREGVFTPELLPNESIESSKIKNGAVISTKIGAGAVLEAALGDGSATSRKIKPTVGFVSATSTLSTTSSFADIPGAKLEITPSVASKLLVFATYVLRPAEAGIIEGTVNLDGTDQTAMAALGTTTSVPTATIPGNYVLTLSAALHTIKLRAKGTGGSVASKEGTGFLYMLVAS